MGDQALKDVPNAQQIEQEASWLGQRLSEPSTYAGLAIVLVALHVNGGQALAGDLQSIGIGIGMVILGGIAIVKREGGSK